MLPGSQENQPEDLLGDFLSHGQPPGSKDVGLDNGSKDMHGMDKMPTERSSEQREVELGSQPDSTKSRPTATLSLITQQLQPLQPLRKEASDAQIFGRQKRRELRFRQFDISKCDAEFMKEIQILSAQGKLDAFERLRELSAECQRVRDLVGPLEQECMDAEQTAEYKFYTLSKAEGNAYNMLTSYMQPSESSGSNVSSIASSFDDEFDVDPERHTTADSLEYGMGGWDSLDDHLKGPDEEFAIPGYEMPVQRSTSIDNYYLLNFSTIRERVSKWILHAALVSRWEAQRLKDTLYDENGQCPSSWAQLVLAFWEREMMRADQHGHDQQVPNLNFLGAQNAQEINSDLISPPTQLLERRSREENRLESDKHTSHEELSPGAQNYDSRSDKQESNPEATTTHNDLMETGIQEVPVVERVVASKEAADTSQTKSPHEHIWKPTTVEPVEVIDSVQNTKGGFAEGNTEEIGSIMTTFKAQLPTHYFSASNSLSIFDNGSTEYPPPREMSRSDNEDTPRRFKSPEGTSTSQGDPMFEVSETQKSTSDILFEKALQTYSMSQSNHAHHKINPQKEFKQGRIFTIIKPAQDELTAIVGEAIRIQQIPICFVIARLEKRCCFCLSLESDPKSSNLNEGQPHSDLAVIYTSEIDLLETKNKSRTFIRDPIRVQLLSSSFQFKPHSRINLAKGYWLRYDTKVRFVGKIHHQSERQFAAVWEHIHPRNTENEIHRRATYQAPQNECKVRGEDSEDEYYIDADSEKIEWSSPSYHYTEQEEPTLQSFISNIAELSSSSTRSLSHEQDIIEKYHNVPLIPKGNF